MKEKRFFRNKGFTLIELLVVIAIIGILVSVVLGSLNTARDKGANAAIKSDLNTGRAQAAIYYDDAGSVYEVDDLTDSVCFNDTSSSIKGIAENITGADSKNLVGGVDCNDDPSAWAAAAQLIGDSAAEYYCVDSAGFADNITGTVGTEFAADALACN